MFLKFLIGKSTSVLLILEVPALGFSLSIPCCRVVRGGRVLARVTDRLADIVTYICGAEHFNQSDSTLKSGDTGLTLDFGNGWLKKGEKTLCTRIFGECQGSKEDVSVCVCSGGTSSESTTIKEAVFSKFDSTYLLSCLRHPPSRRYSLLWRRINRRPGTLRCVP